MIRFILFSSNVYEVTVQQWLKLDADIKKYATIIVDNDECEDVISIYTSKDKKPVA